MYNVLPTPTQHHLEPLCLQIVWLQVCVCVCVCTCVYVCVYMCVCSHHVVVWSLPQCTLKRSSTLSVAQSADQHVPTPPPLMAVPHNACRDASVPPNMVEYNGDCIMASNCTISTLPPPPRPPIIVATNFTSG